MPPKQLPTDAKRIFITNGIASTDYIQPVWNGLSFAASTNPFLIRGYAMKIKQIAAVVVLALGLSGLANAKTDPLSFAGNSAYLGNSFSAATEFTDFFTFNIPALNTGAAIGNALSGFSFSPTAGLQPTVTFSFFDLYSGSVNGASFLAATGTFGFNSIYAQVFGNNLGSGDYFLKVVGTVGSGGGSYGGNFTLATLPVPEPESYAMFLAGLGLMGFIARRRSRQV